MRCFYLLDIAATAAADKRITGESVADMDDIESILSAGEPDALKELKVFLFKENVRLNGKARELAELEEKLLAQQAQFKSDTDALKRKISMEQKRLKENNRFFDQKLEILKDAYRQLDVDKKKLEKERARFELEKNLLAGGNRREPEGIAAVLFRGANNPLALRKRYKDLLKIFHPDNLCGDEKLVQLINREYEKRKKAE